MIRPRPIPRAMHRPSKHPGHVLECGERAEPVSRTNESRPFVALQRTGAMGHAIVGIMRHDGDRV
jgi:hypothetical protein